VEAGDGGGEAGLPEFSLGGKQGEVVLHLDHEESVVLKGKAKTKTTANADSLRE
jgi:hypothetical protein